MSTSGVPSLEPYLRARAVNPSLIPSNTPRTARTHISISPPIEPDFFEFLQKLGKWAVAPITVPLGLIQTALTSPITLSLILKLALLSFLTLASAIFSVLAVGAFWWSWGTGGTVEVEAWLIYGSKHHRTPHALVLLPLEKFQEDLRYDVEVEMELVRPSRGAEEMGNFMLALDLRSQRNSEVTVIGAAQPSLPPPPLPPSLFQLPFPSFPISSSLLPPCVIPYPFRGLCPSRLFGYGGKADSKIKERRKKGAFSSPAKGKDVVLLRKELMEGVMIRPGRGGDSVIGSAFVSVGREDSFTESQDGGPGCQVQPREVRTTGWVVIRFIPKPTGVRWLLTSHPLPPLLLLPPLSLSLTFSSSIFAFFVITYLRRSKPKSRSKAKRTHSVPHVTEPMSEAALLAEKRARTFEQQDRAEKEEAERRKNEWEEVENSAMGGMKRMPEDKKRNSRIGESTVGGSETTAPTALSSFAPIPEGSSEDGSSESTITETATESGIQPLAPLSGLQRRTVVEDTDDDDGDWEDAQ